MGDTTTPALMICQRCGNVVGTWHTKPMCDAAYDRAYRAAGGDVVASVAAERAWWRERIEALAEQFSATERHWRPRSYDAYADGQRDAWDAAEQTTRTLLAEDGARP